MVSKTATKPSAPPRDHFLAPPSNWRPRCFPAIGAYGQGAGALAGALRKVADATVHGHIESIPVDDGERLLFMAGLQRDGAPWTWRETFEYWETTAAASALCAAFTGAPAALHAGDWESEAEQYTDDW